MYVCYLAICLWLSGHEAPKPGYLSWLYCNFEVPGLNFAGPNRPPARKPSAKRYAMRHRIPALLCLAAVVLLSGIANGYYLPGRSRFYSRTFALTRNARLAHEWLTGVPVTNPQRALTRNARSPTSRRHVSRRIPEGFHAGRRGQLPGLFWTRRYPLTITRCRSASPRMGSRNLPDRSTPGRSCWGSGLRTPRTRSR